MKDIERRLDGIERLIDANAQATAATLRALVGALVESGAMDRQRVMVILDRNPADPGAAALRGLLGNLDGRA